MSDHSLPAVGSLSPSQAQYVDQVCLDFEAAWKKPRIEKDLKKRPRIEEYLGDAGEPERSVLLRELLALELAYRIPNGERPVPEEYLARFPQHHGLVRKVFTEAAHKGATGLPVPGIRRQGDPAQETGGADPEQTGPELAPPQADSVPSVEQSPDPPEIPGYKIIKVLGQGGMGIVYKARQVALKRVVALKMILAGGNAGPQELARFRTEAEAVARLQHANIVQIYEVGDSGGLPYFTLEYVPGGSLSDSLAKSLQQPGGAARLVEQLARAVHCAHQQGIVHRDLKPANVLLAKNGTPKITDFGLAKQVEGGPGLTQSGAIMGTPSYMAPEQARGETKASGPAADVYALGAILYECLTGRPPFRGPTPADTLVQVLNEEPVPVRRLQPKVPKDLETICHKCLQKEPHKRSASAKALAEDLRRFQAGEPIRARPLGRVKRLLKWARRRPAVAALLGVTALAVLLGVTVFALMIARKTEQEKTRATVQTALVKMGETTDPNDLSRLAGAVGALAGQLDTAGARASMQTALEQMGKTTNADALSRLSEAVGTLAAQLDAAGARASMQTALEQMGKTNDPDVLRNLSEAVAKLAAQLDAAGARELAPKILEQMGQITEAYALSALSSAVAMLATKLDAAEASKHCAQAVVKVLAQMDKTKDADALSRLSQAVAWLARKLDAAEASRHYAQAAVKVLAQMGKTTNSDALITLAEVVVTLAAKLYVTEASKLYTQAAVKFLDQMNAADLRARFRLSEAVATLAAKLDGEGAREVTPKVLEAIRRFDRTSRGYFDGPPKALSATVSMLAAKLNVAGAREVAPEILRLMYWTTNQDTLVELSRAVGALAAQMIRQEVAALLTAHPLPAPAAKELLPELEKIAGRKFANLDEAAKWFREN